MQEYVTEAVVLDKAPFKDLDARYALFTKRFGKLVGKATSVRKITSKLAGHLEPGTLATVRFVERSGGSGNGNGGGNFTQVVDALKVRKLAVALPDLRGLNLLLHEGEPDAALWEGLVGVQPFSWPRVLSILGWDPAHAVCEGCGSAETAYFHLPRQEFFCAVCASKLRRNELILVVHAQI